MDEKEIADKLCNIIEEMRMLGIQIFPLSRVNDNDEYIFRYEDFISISGMVENKTDAYRQELILLLKKAIKNLNTYLKEIENE